MVSKAVGFWGREDHLRTVLLADAPINDGDVEVNTSSVARWPRKQAAINPNLNLFTIPPTDLSTASYRYVKVPPQTASITPIHVYIEIQSITFIWSGVLWNCIWDSRRREMPISLHAMTLWIAWQLQPITWRKHSSNKSISELMAPFSQDKRTCTISKPTYRRCWITTEMMERPFFNPQVWGMKSIRPWRSANKTCPENQVKYQ